MDTFTTLIIAGVAVVYSVAMYARDSKRGEVETAHLWFGYGSAFAIVMALEVANVLIPRLWS